MKNNFKKETIRVGADLWEVCYNRIDDTMVKISVYLLRPNAKWYQSKALFSDWTCSNKQEDFDFKKMALIEKYYQKMDRIEKLNEFFEKPIDK